jgi:hypothetical protein
VGFAIGRRFRLIPGWTSELIGKPHDQAGKPFTP